MLPFTDYEINQTAERDTAEERRIEKRAQEEEEFTLYLASLLPPPRRAHASSLKY